MLICQYEYKAVGKTYFFLGKRISFCIFLECNCFCGKLMTCLWLTPCIYIITFTYIFEAVPLVEFMSLVFTSMPGESYLRRLSYLRPSLLYLGYVFWALINSLVCWYDILHVMSINLFWHTGELYLSGPGGGPGNKTRRARWLGSDAGCHWKCGGDLPTSADSLPAQGMSLVRAVQFISCWSLAKVHSRMFTGKW